MLYDSSKKVHYKFTCEKCDYYTNRKSQYKRHLQTNKHNAINAISNGIEKVPFSCECGKVYKQQPSLSRHKKTCTYNPEAQNEAQETNIPDTPTLTSLLMKLIETNEDLKEQIIDLASKPRTINNNNNKTFNLNNFLNVDCKDAMNLSEFLDTLQYTFKDLLYLGEKGFVKSIENTFVKQLGDMEQTKRPIHCTDKKRKTMYVKDEDRWEKDNDNEKIASAIKTMNKKQLTAFTNHSRTRPEDYLDSDHNAHTQHGIIQQMCGYTHDTSYDVNKKILGRLVDATEIKK